MSSSPAYKVIVTEYFKKQLKRLLKKHRGLLDVFKNVIEGFNKQNATSLGMGVYKVRLQGQGKGKSGGYRLYVFVMEIEGILTPIYIYSKNEKENLTHKELAIHLERTRRDLV